MTISTGDIEAIVQLFEQSKWKELELQFGESELFLGKDSSGRASWEARGAGAARIGPAAAPTSDATPLRAAAPAATPRAASAATGVPDGCVVVTAPSLGTFYRSAKSGSAPFVEIGQRVDEDTELCLVEVMKLFTTLPAGVAGVVREVLAKDGDLVEFGQPLFVVDTNG